MPRYTLDHLLMDDAGNILGRIDDCGFAGWFWESFDCSMGYEESEGRALQALYAHLGMKILGYED